jgi:hypothetical protein
MKTALDRMVEAARRSDWIVVETVAREWLSEQRFFVPHLFLINALIESGRLKEADREFENLTVYKFNIAERLDGFPIVAERYKERVSRHYLDSRMTKNMSNTYVLGANVARWKVRHRIETRADYLEEARVLIETAASPGNLHERAEAVICTFGSCFAANLTRMLVDNQINAISLLIEESVNSTYANRVLLECVIGAGNGPAHEEMVRAFGRPFIENVAKKLSMATHIVLTIGVAPSFFSTETGGYVFRENYKRLLASGKVVMRTTTCSENVDNLRAVLSILNILAPDARKVITVSPVPLEGTLEFPSIVVADCVSKSVLRAAVHEVQSLEPDLLYFPSFEIVKWLSAYSMTDVFGAEDGDSRHVSDWVVDFITSGFMNLYFTPEA